VLLLPQGARKATSVGNHPLCRGQLLPAPCHPCKAAPSSMAWLSSGLQRAPARAASPVNSRQLPQAGHALLLALPHAGNKTLPSHPHPPGRSRRPSASCGSWLVGMSLAGEASPSGAPRPASAGASGCRRSSQQCPAFRPPRPAGQTSQMLRARRGETGVCVCVRGACEKWGGRVGSREGDFTRELAPTSQHFTHMPACLPACPAWHAWPCPPMAP